MADYNSDDTVDVGLNSKELDSKDLTSRELSSGNEEAENESIEEVSSDNDEVENESYDEQSECNETAENELYEKAVKAANMKDSEWQCDVCYKRYKDQHYLKEHVKTHKANETKPKKELCEICQVDCKTKAQLQIHMTFHDPGRPALCKVCNLRYMNKNGLLQHIRSHTNRVVAFCPECGLQCDTLKILHHHVKKHDDRKDFQCQFCDKKYKIARTLQVHLQTCGTGSRDRPVQCHLCEKAYRQVKNLKAHLRTHHKGSEDKELLQCHLCDKTYVKARNLQAHLETFHKDEESEGPPFNCDQCPKSFALRTKLMQHRKEHIRPFKCPLCKFAARARIHLEKHLLTHNRIKSEGKAFSKNSSKRGYLICPFCNLEFKQEEVLVHIRTIHNKETPSCTVCSKEFRTLYHLNKHKTVHSVEYICKICGRQMKSKGNLTTHMRIHMQPKRPKKQPICKFCGQIFNTINTMYCHVREKHSLFDCNCCGKIFRKRQDLEKHMMGHELERKFGQPLGGATSAFDISPGASGSRTPLTIKPEPQESRTPSAANRRPTELIEICPESDKHHRDHSMEFGVNVSPKASSSSASEMSRNTLESSRDASYLAEETNTADIDSYGYNSARSHEGFFTEISMAFAKSQQCAVIADPVDQPGSLSGHDSAKVLEIVPVNETFESPKEGSSSIIEESDFINKISDSKVGSHYSSGGKCDVQKENSISQNEKPESRKELFNSDRKMSGMIISRSHNTESAIVAAQLETEAQEFDTNIDDSEDSDTDYDDIENPLYDDTDNEYSDIDSENADTDSSMEYDDTDIRDMDSDSVDNDDTDNDGTDFEMESDDADIADTDVSDRTDKHNNGDKGISDTGNAEGGTNIDDTDTGVSLSEKFSGVKLDRNSKEDCERTEKFQVDLDNAEHSESPVEPESPSVASERPSVGIESPSGGSETPSGEDGPPTCLVENNDSDVLVTLNNLNDAELSLDGENGSVTFVIDYDETGALVVCPVIK